MTDRKGNSFPPTLRLRCRREFGLVRNRGRKNHSPHFIVVVMEKDAGPTRLGLTVSRKVGGAVQRNRVKRLLREFFRINYDRLLPNADISIIAKKGAPELDLAGVTAELKFLLVGSPPARTSCSVS